MAFGEAELWCGERPVNDSSRRLGMHVLTNQQEKQKDIADWFEIIPIRHQNLLSFLEYISL